MNTCMNEINSDSSERKYVHLSNGLIQSFEIRYALWIWIFSGRCGFLCRNVTLAHCSVLVCNYVSPFFLYLKECIVIWKFGSTVSCGLTRETTLTKYKPIACRTCLLDCMKCSTLDGDPFTRWHLSGENEVLYGRIVVCLSQERLGYSTKYIIHWNWDIKTS